jgi:hypothetical protein
MDKVLAHTARKKQKLVERRGDVMSLKIFGYTYAVFSFDMGIVSNNWCELGCLLFIDKNGGRTAALSCFVA